jgi:hypothetical protein
MSKESFTWEKESKEDEAYKKIFACFENTDSISSESAKEIERIKENGVNVNWFANKDEMDSRQFKSGEEKTYVISPVDSTDKYSEDFKVCVGVIGVGQGRDGSDLSFLLHHDIHEVFFYGGEELEGQFEKDYTDTLIELKKLSVDGSLDIGFFGGTVPLAQANWTEEWKNKYTSAMERLGEIAQSILGSEPVIITGPKARIGAVTNAYVSTKDRRLYMTQEDYDLGHGGKAGDAKDLYKDNQLGSILIEE